MTTLINPLATTILGAPVFGQPPPELRAEGAPMTPAQLEAARVAFLRFDQAMRVAQFTNHSEQGFLPDGSRYRIVFMGGHRIMQVWPVSALGAADAFRWGPGGILLRYGEADFVRAFYTDRWHAKAIETGYCGTNVVRLSRRARKKLGPGAPKYLCDNFGTTRAPAGDEVTRFGRNGIIDSRSVLEGVTTTSLGYIHDLGEAFYCGMVNKDGDSVFLAQKGKSEYEVRYAPGLPDPSAKGEDVREVVGGGDFGSGTIYPVELPATRRIEDSHFLVPAISLQSADPEFEDGHDGEDDHDLEMGGRVPGSRSVQAARRLLGEVFQTRTVELSRPPTFVKLSKISATPPFDLTEEQFPPVRVKKESTIKSRVRDDYEHTTKSPLIQKIKAFPNESRDPTDPSRYSYNNINLPLETEFTVGYYVETKRIREYSRFGTGEYEIWLAELTDLDGRRYTAALDVKETVDDKLLRMSRNVRRQFYAAYTDRPANFEGQGAHQSPGMAIGLPGRTVMNRYSDWADSLWVSPSEDLRIDQQEEELESTTHKEQTLDDATVSLRLGGHHLELLKSDLQLLIEKETGGGKPGDSEPPEPRYEHRLSGSFTVASILALEEKTRTVCFIRTKSGTPRVDLVGFGYLTEIYEVEIPLEHEFVIWRGGRDLFVKRLGQSTYMVDEEVFNTLPPLIPSEFLKRIVRPLPPAVGTVPWAVVTAPPEYELRGSDLYLVKPGEIIGVETPIWFETELSYSAGDYTFTRGTPWYAEFTRLVKFEKLLKEVVGKVPVKYAVDPLSGGVAILCDHANVLISPSGDVSPVSTTTGKKDDGLEFWCSSL